MAVDLLQLDGKMTEVEEFLLAALRRVRKQELEETYLVIDEEASKLLKSDTARLKHDLEHSGDADNLSLQTNEHEVLAARIKVLIRLLTRDIATGYVHEAHELAVQGRQKLERKVAAERKADSPSIPEPAKKTSLMGSLRGFLKKNETEAEQQRNRLNVSVVEKEVLDPEAGYLDKGIFSASRELAILADLIETNKHRPPPPPLPKDRAQFSSRDLSKSAPVSSDRLAQTPEEIRRKLAARASAAAGPSSFMAKDLSATQNMPVAPVPAASQDTLARSPEEIRRKLAERQGQSSGKASFMAKDIEPASPPPAKKDPFLTAEQEKQEEKPKPGRAVFESKDLPERKP